ncbi:hypothetical protein A1O1_03430 [Capronia coronata CBS 617.96]|uniref:Zn(2)-C6 fungal-type domain-containing protein n=1 Tax=Capronia coronata CBS 617.96 TaxID=1182541 RepID=W9YM84_9EURO|nr:uncharacterized protein A1O1_03430 [Capronia coronata CBS 617.96]EXJ90331.1 hypothetical protein A1O1_03430 [Capronia coronata CBS 617.96]
MSEAQDRRQVQRVAKSCTECRRRKVRCIRTPPDAAACRSCEDRGTICVPHVSSPRPIREQRLPSRYRIAQLESEVTKLREAVRGIQQNLGYRPPAVSDSAVADSGSTVDTHDHDSDDDSSVSDVLAAEQPAHLRSLFHNEWLSLDTPDKDDPLTNSKAKASVHLLDIARQALRKLIPSLDEIAKHANSGSGWLVLVQALLPMPFAVKSYQEILEHHHIMQQPDVDPIDLASWLLDFAVISLQSGQEQPPLSPAASPQNGHGGSPFSRAVSDTVDATILSHHRLAGSIRGLGMAVRLIRLQLCQGKFEKVWLRLRHVIAIAELVGIPMAARAAQRVVGSGAADASQLESAQLWEMLCSIDRILAMILNLPPGTWRFQHTAREELVVDGVVQVHAYLTKLTDIACRLQSLDDLSTAEGSIADVYASALELDRELRVLASHTPKSWWDEDPGNVRPEHIVQHLHFYIMMRVHLPFTMRGNPDDEYVFSRLACLDACETVARRYQLVRRVFPSGMFLSRILDLQAFTATVVLILMSHSYPSTGRLDMQANKARVEARVLEVINLLEEKCRDSPGSSLTQRGLVTIRSLYTLLQQDWQGSDVQQLRLKVPLLGTVHVRRNEQGAPASEAHLPQALQAPMDSALGMMDQQFNAQSNGTSAVVHGAPWPATTQPQADWSQNPFSWSIEEDYRNYFQDALMAEDSDQFLMWQSGTNTFPMQ